MVDFPLPCLVGCLIGIQRYWFISIPPKKNLGSFSSLPFPSPPGWSTGFPHIPGAAFMAGALFLRFLAIQGPLLREGNLNHSLQPALDFSNMYLYYSRWMLGGLGKKKLPGCFFLGGEEIPVNMNNFCEVHELHILCWMIVGKFRPELLAHWTWQKSWRFLRISYPLCLLIAICPQAGGNFRQTTAWTGRHIFGSLDFWYDGIAYQHSIIAV